MCAFGYQAFQTVGPGELLTRFRVDANYGANIYLSAWWHNIGLGDYLIPIFRRLKRSIFQGLQLVCFQ